MKKSKSMSLATIASVALASVMLVACGQKESADDKTNKIQAPVAAAEPAANDSSTTAAPAAPASHAVDGSAETPRQATFNPNLAPAKGNSAVSIQLDATKK